MGEDSSESPAAAHAHDWPLRPWLLAALLGLAGLLIHFTTSGQSDSPGRMALAAFLFFGPLSAGFALERERWKSAAIFALAAGLVMAGLAWRAVAAGDHTPNSEYGFGAGVLAAVLAVPLFQAGFPRLRFRTPYQDTHFFVWTDAVSAGGALAFTGLSWLMLLVLAQLFHLLRIELLRDVLDDGWFAWTISGVAFGAALGLLRNSLKILGTLQSVVLLLLSLLAVPLALALVAFLLAMVVSGPAVLWEATQSATPVLLACALGAFVLTNAIVRDDDTDMTRSPVMRAAAFVLALGILPLTLFAAVSMGTRIAQHGLSPERLWGLVAIAVACAYGVAALGAVIRGRLWDWRPYLRRANLTLSVGVSVLALILALPIFDFGAISAANQVARLESGKVAAEQFDYAALRWDFGDAGRKRLAALAKSSDAQIARLAEEARAREGQPFYTRELPDGRDQRLANLRMAFTDPNLRAETQRWVREESGACARPCTMLDLGTSPGGKLHLALVEGDAVSHLTSGEEGHLEYGTDPTNSSARTDLLGSEQGKLPRVEVRPYRGRQIYVDGKPAGQPFE